MRTIFHLDLDAFFVSVERILDPSLIGKPVIVGGDPSGRGVVAACSYEARKFGLHSAMPVKKAFNLCPHGIYLHGHYDEYLIYSKNIKNFLKEYAPVLEQASIDEFYMDFTGTEKIYGQPFEFAKFLQTEIKKIFFLPASIGIASNKNLAKIGSDFKKPLGITFIPAHSAKHFLSLLPVQKMPGIGNITLEKLNSKGIYKIGDIADLPLEYFTAEFGKFGFDLWTKANGEGCEFLTVEREQKSISKESTFSYDINNKAFIENLLFKLSAFVAQKLRDEQILTSNICIKLRYSDFQTLQRSKKIKPTNDDKIIFDTARNLFINAYTRRVSVRLIGIKLSQFIPASKQLFLFEDINTHRQKLLKAITQIRKKYGYTKIHFGVNENNSL